MTDDDDDDNDDVDDSDNIRSNVLQLEVIAFVRNLRTRFGTIASAINSV